MRFCKWKCPNCAREQETSSGIIMVFCRCGHYMKKMGVKG
jgi:hypothetical protein